MCNTSKGQVAIPADISDQPGLLSHTEVEVELDGMDVRIMRTPSMQADGRGARVVAHLKAHQGNVPLSTDAIMALTRGE
jgi:hypothetical protein